MRASADTGRFASEFLISNHRNFPRAGLGTLVCDVSEEMKREKEVYCRARNPARTSIFFLTQVSSPTSQK